MKNFTIEAKSREEALMIGDCVKAHYGIWTIRKYPGGKYIVDVGVDNILQKISILKEIKRVAKLKKEETVIDVMRFISRKKQPSL